LQHTSPWLWELHKVHHSAEVLTPITVYRTHPLESYINGLRGALVTGLVAGFFAYLSRGRASSYLLLGVPAMNFLFNLLGSNLRHSHIWLSYGAKIEHILISPAQHQIHHSVEIEESMSNYGAFLAIWDWLGSSLTIASQPPKALGLPPAEQNHAPDSVLSAILGPLRALFLRGLKPFKFLSNNGEPDPS
jgi:sterol desaturase/sphingolipid hydroxylase (fatty acid hydroxylase superfamily)